MSFSGALRALFQRRRYEEELQEELQFHVDARTAEWERKGLSRAEARRRARVELGGPESHKDGMRQAHGLGWVDDLVSDLRYAIRTLRRSPAFTLVAVGSLALAIGANTNIFSVTNELLFMRLDVPRAKDLRLLTATAPSPSVSHSNWGSSITLHGISWNDSVPYPIFKRLQAENRSMEGIAGYKDLFEVNVTANGAAKSRTAEVVSGNLFDVLQTRPQLGRLILPSDEGADGTGFVAVLSDSYWKTEFGGRTDVVGKVIRVNGNTLTIVGVSAPGFTGPASTTVSPDLFLPISLVTRLQATFLRHQSFLSSPDLWWVNMIARARPDVPDAKTATELSVLLASAIRGTQTVKPGDHIPRIQINDGSRGVRFFDSEGTPLKILLALTTLVLLLACVNIANLMVARTAARMREMSVRLALGASRGRILRQIITESLLISASGGALGFLLGYCGRNVLVKLYMGRGFLTHSFDVHFDWRVFALTATVTLATGLLFGILPAWRATRANVSAGLKATAPTASKRRGASTGKLLISVQLAISTLLVAGAALFVRTLWNLNHVDPGFSTANLLQFDVTAPTERYANEAVPPLLERIRKSVGALPGMREISVAQPALLNGSQWDSDFHVEGLPKPTKDRANTSSYYSSVSPGFFETMGIRLLRGRGITEADTSTAPPVAVINETEAKTQFAGMDPLGRRFNIGDDPTGKKPPVWYTVVGICADTQYSGLRQAQQPLHFDSILQSKELNGGTFVVRTTLPPAEAVPAIRRVLAGIDADLPMRDVRTLDQQIADSLNQERLIATLTAGFGVLALLLASVGIYGLMAYTVAQQTNEIGIRLALGARRLQVRAAVLREVVLLTGLGVAMGVVGVLAAMHLMRSVLYDTEDNFHGGMLFGLHGYDPVSLWLTLMILIAVALMAAWLPAARASRVEPMEALRHE